MQTALGNEFGGIPYIGCTGPRYNTTVAGANSTDNGRTIIDEVWYYMHVSFSSNALIHSPVESVQVNEPVQNRFTVVRKTPMLFPSTQLCPTPRAPTQQEPSATPSAHRVPCAQLPKPPSGSCERIQPLRVDGRKGTCFRGYIYKCIPIIPRKFKTWRSSTLPTDHIRP